MIILMLCVNQIASAQAPIPAIGFRVFSPLSPQEVAKFMKKNFEFIEDKKLFGVEDYWQSPEEFLGRQKGDCEDYALFTDYLLKSSGFESWIISFYDQTGYGHTVTFFKVNGKFNVMNEDRLYTYQSNTMAEGLTKIHPTWTWAAFAKRQDGRGIALRTFQNPAFNS